MCSLVAALSFGLVSCAPETVEAYTEVARDPDVRPDFFGTVIPANIAPLNFQVLEPGQAYLVNIHAGTGKPIAVASKTGAVRIPLKQWRALLAANRGQTISVDVFVKEAGGGWKKFQSLTNTVAAEDVDDVLVFRLMKPIYNWWKSIGIYQRRLADYRTSVVLHGRSFGEGCLNCHSFVGNEPETLTIGLRSAEYGSSTLLAQGNTVEKIDSKWGYTAWHPSGKLAVYSLSKVRQFFHRGGPQVRDVVDLDSALACYMVERREVVCPPQFSDKDRLETYPTWSPDGKYLYFCSGPILWEDRDTVPPKNYEKLKYDLCRVSYDVATDTWGPVETVLSAEQTGLSILLPRVSPDGRFLLFCMCQYGCFPIYQPSSDLYLMDLTAGTYRKLAINSNYSESWHSWSSNSRWIAFSSKRQGGLFTRTFLSYVDETGTAHKPVIVPQEDPCYYDALLETHSTPELVKGEVKAGRAALARTARSAATIVAEAPISGATPKAKPIESWQERE
ncbi:MAG: PD40 domain-containing protein [Phycisphaerales bacterium]|nr:MAG: PD40 domain-containing protein [Phycisphaerales bacterium]